MNNKYIMTTKSADRVGIVAALTNCLATHDGFINELAQFGTPSSLNFFSRIEFTMSTENLSPFKTELDGIIKRFDLRVNIVPTSERLKAVIMTSKHDHCINDLLYRVRKNSLNIDIVAVVSNHETSRNLVEQDDIPYHYIHVTKDTKPAAEASLRKILNDTSAELIILARYMQILSEDMCRDYAGKIINIHHSFLPSFKGAKPYHRAYARGVKLIGATAHYVTTDLDEGPIIEQSVQRVDHTMTSEDLIAMGRDVESQTLARAVKLHSEHRSFLNGRKTVILP
ncbi:MAG: formyltetrahydrofolate deformylase [Maricaulaceae bacterium]